MQRIWIPAAISLLMLIIINLWIFPQTDKNSFINTRSTTTGQQENSFAIANAQLFDGKSLQNNIHLIVVDGRISEMGEDIELPSDLPVLDTEGKTLLPGLIDAHTHSYGNALADSLRFGVTTNLDMFTAPHSLQSNRMQRRKVVKTRQADMFSAGMLATAPGGHGTQFGVPVETLTKPEEADAWVDRRIAEGSDYIKIVYEPYHTFLPSLDRATASALIDAAHQRGLMAVAHIASLRAAEDMVRDNIDGLVHIFADEKATPEFAQLALQAGIFVTPTLSVIAAIDADNTAEELATDEFIQPFLTPAQTQMLKASYGRSIPGFDLALAKDNVRLLYKAGVAILAGSDAPNPGTSHGVSQHHELSLLVEAGLPPTAALASATSAPAQQFGLGDRGVIAKGSKADFIIVEGNPTDDITATRRIAKVIKNGYVVDRKTETSSVAEVPAQLGDFEKGLTAPDGFIWSATDDRQFGGRSMADIAATQGGADNSTNALQVKAHVRAGFFVPWAGAYFGVARSPQQPRDLSPYSELSFAIKGTPGKYRVMLFTSAMSGAPPTQEITVDKNWQSVSLAISAFKNFDAKDFTGLAIVAGPERGEFQYHIDNVRFKK